MVLKQLTDLRGVSGNERTVREYIMDRIAPLADEVRVDRMGNVIALKKGTDPRAERTLLCAHMDEVGMIVLGIGDDGLLSYQTVGGIDPRVVVSKRVLVGEKAVPGVIGAKAIHLQTREEMQRVLDHKDLYIDIGAKDKASAEKLVKPGDYVSFDSRWVEFGDHMVKAKALDDRVGCYALMRVLEKRYPGDVICAFTTQEEVGLRGARVAAFQVEAHRALILEGTTANDMGDVPDHLRVCVPGKGVAISFMDRASIAHRGLFESLRKVAAQSGIHWQLKNFVSGGNDAGAVQTAQGGVPTAVLSVPCRYIHSASSVASLDDVESQYALVDAFLSADVRVAMN